MNKAPNVDYYAVLQVARTADFKTLKKAYFSRAKECHPDLFGGDRGKEDEFKRLVNAFDTLSDPEKKRKYDRSFFGAREVSASADIAAAEDGPGTSIMDSEADDTLEELIVGNNPPPGATLATLFLDLAGTEVFMTFREGKDLFYQGRYRAAAERFHRASEIAPGNILYLYFLGKTYAVLGRYRLAIRYYRAALRVGERRVPPQRLDRARQELNWARTKWRPWWYRFIGLFEAKSTGPLISEDEKLIQETNRAIARLAREEEEKKRRLNS